jgi:hypothetical protein
VIGTVTNETLHAVFDSGQSCNNDRAILRKLYDGKIKDANKLRWEMSIYKQLLSMHACDPGCVAGYHKHDNYIALLCDCRDGE